MTSRSERSPLGSLKELPCSCARPRRPSRHLFFLTAGLTVAAIAGFALPASAETMRVKNIRVSESAGDTAVVIGASARPIFTTWKLEQPARVVVELSGARLGEVNVPMDAGTYAVGLVSASVTEDESAGPRTRIVLTLRQPADYRVEAKGSDIILRVVPRVRPVSATAAKSEADSTAAAQQKAEAQKAEAQLREEAKQRAAAEAKAEEKAQAEAAARLEAERLRRELAQAQRETAKVRADAKAEERALVEAKAEEHSRAEAAAKQEAERLRKELAQAQREAAQVRADAKAAERSHAEAKAQESTRAEAKAQASTRAEAAAKLEADRLRDQLAAAQREAAHAKAAAEAATVESRRQKVALELAELRAAQAETQAQQARQRAQLAEGETAAARGRESDRNQALRAAVREVEARQKALDRIAQEQREQQTQLERAAGLVGQREQAVHASEANLAKLEKEARAARLRQERLSRDASEQHKADAAAALAEAERQREGAAKVTEQSRVDLARAVSARRQEEGRKEEQSQLRRVEEAKLAAAVASRKAEEARLSNAQADRIRLEEERTRLESERSKLESTRQGLLAEVQRIKSEKAAASVTKPAAVAAPVAGASVATPVAAAPKPASPAPTNERPRSITLRAPSQVRAIDFVDEPSRASVIIDVDASTTVSVERVAGRRLSLRLEHSELPERLERNLDATEYLGPVKVITSYRDRVARGTVRVDVDLAEDVPNRIRQEGHRIYWDFQKAQGKAPSLPAVLFVPARKVAGFVATAQEGLWLAQTAAPPPYLAPPAEAPATGAPATAPATAAAPDRASEGRSGGTGPSRTSLGKKRYVGRRIDLDFKGADIHNILRLLADVGQVNVIVADDVRGEVTIKMRDVPWDQALDVVLRSKGLGSVREGNLLRVAPLPLLEKELEAEIARQKQIADVLPLETRLIGVSYAEAGTLQDKARDLLTPRGKISVDTRTNTLIVSDVVKSLQLVEDLVRNLDTQTSQVVIEARIVEANSNFARQIGVQWGGTAFADTAHANPTGLVFPYNVGIGGGADDGSAPLGGLVPQPRGGTGTSTSPNFLVNMPAAAGLGTGSAIGLTMGSVAGAFNLNLRLSAYESTGSVRILSSPRITTMDNIDASISQGVSIPVSTVSAMGAQTQFVDAKLSLTVKPHVTNEGTIALNINVTRNEPDFVNTGARGDPTIQKKEARTTMLVRDGDTAVIGGIYTRNTGLSSQRVPFFSDIPILGWFFRNKKENDNRSEFLVFITPRIVNRARVAGQ